MLSLLLLYGWGNDVSEMYFFLDERLFPFIQLLFLFVLGLSFVCPAFLLLC